MTRGSPKRRAEVALARFHGRGLEPVEGVLGQDALVTHAFDFEELAIDLVAEIAQMREIRRPPLST